MAGPGVSPRALGILRRPDGSKQVTYFGQPLYMFAFDLGSGQPGRTTNGEAFLDPAVNGVWYTVSADGLSNPGAPTVTTESTSHGTDLALAGSNGAAAATLYAFSPDSATRSRCEGTCARIWPPLLTSAPPVAGTGLKGASARSSGRTAPSR